MPVFAMVLATSACDRMSTANADQRPNPALAATARSPAALAPSTPAGESAKPGPESATPEPEPEPAPSRPTDACGPEMVRFDSYCIDRFEAHVVYTDGTGNFVRHPHNQQLKKSARYEARASLDVLPQAYIDRFGASGACENAGKRLCTVSEWYEACRGAARHTYPYGNRFEKTRCNTSKPHLLSLLFGTNPRAWKYEEHFNNPELNQLDGFLAKTGAHPACKTEEGLYDLVGNLHEWVSDRVDRGLAQKLPLLPGIRRALRRATGHGIFMGGFFSTTHEHGRGCNFVTIGHSPDYHDYSTGFRCCKDVRR